MQICRIKKNLFNNSITEGRAHLNSFSGATINRLDHFITPTLKEDRPDIVIIRVGSDDIMHNTINDIDANCLKMYFRHRKKVFAIWCKRSDNLLFKLNKIIR